MISRRTVLWLCALAVLLNLLALASQTILPWNGDAGFATAPTATPFILKVTSVYGPALKSGLRAGDLIDVRRDDYTGQLSIPGRPGRFTALRSGKPIPITIIPVQVPPTWGFLVRLFTVFWLIAFAATIAARGAPTRRNMLLAMVLVALAIESPVFANVYPSWLLSFAGTMLAAPIFQLQFVLLALFATSFGTPIPRSRAVLLIATCAFALLATVAMSLHLVADYTTWIGVTQSLVVWGYHLWMVPAIPCVLGGIAAFNVASGGDRQRLAWVFVPFSIFWAVLTVDTYVQAYESSTLWDSIENAALLVVPLGLTYAALSRRLFDIGFVINRAAVFAGISVIVVGSFVLLEWALGKWFEGTSHATSIVLNAALALGFGLSLRFIHARVDRFVDNVFFKKRHDDENALKRFAREAAYITDRATLLERTHAEVLEHSDAPDVRVSLAESLDANDPAILAMKTWHDAIDLHNYETAIDGEYAFPMLAHGQLLGVIVCDAKTNGEAFAPDEIDALKTVAHGVGVALHSLNAAGDDSIASLRESIVTAVATMQDNIITELRASRTT